MTEARTPRLGVVAAFVIGIIALNLSLRAVGLPVLASALNFLVMAGALVYAFIREGRRDKRRAKTWGDSWRRRHLLMIALSLLIGFSAVLIPNSDQSAWVLVPILLAIIPLMFTPLATLGQAPSAHDEERG